MVVEPRTGGLLRRAGWIAFAAAVLTVGLITYGSWVRASGSGLGCPDWPLCEGAVVPELDGATAIEFGHRLFAGVTMLTAAAAAWFAWRGRRSDAVTARLLIGAFAAILFQAGLGGATVLTELHGMVRLAHLATAMATLGLLTAGAIRALDLPWTPSPSKRTAAALLAGVAVVVLAGGAVVGAGVSGGCPGLPFCDDRSTAGAAWLHGAHRVAGAALVVALAWSTLELRRVRGTRFAVGLNHAAAALVAVQIAIGIWAVAQDLPGGLRVLHLGVATLVWWAIVGQWALVALARKR